MLHAAGVILIFAAVVARPRADRRGARAKGRHAVVERRDFVAPGDEARGGQVVRHLRDVGADDRGVAFFIDPDGVVGTEAVALTSTVKARRREQQTDAFVAKQSQQKSIVLPLRRRRRAYPAPVSPAQGGLFLPLSRVPLFCRQKYPPTRQRNRAFGSRQPKRPHASK